MLTFRRKQIYVTRSIVQNVVGMGKTKWQLSEPRGLRPVTDRQTLSRRNVGNGARPAARIHLERDKKRCRRNGYRLERQTAPHAATFRRQMRNVFDALWRESLRSTHATENDDNHSLAGTAGPVLSSSGHAGAWQTQADEGRSSSQKIVSRRISKRSRIAGKGARDNLLLHTHRVRPYLRTDSKKAARICTALCVAHASLQVARG